MKKPNNLDLGIMFRREHPPEQLPDFARQAENFGFDEIWVVEDCFYGSGIASATQALAVTDHIGVGVGILPAVVRNPVFTAMEIATLARLHPGRLIPGIGHGVRSWMEQIGALPSSQLAALEEVTIIVKSLLRGENINFSGRFASVTEAELVFPPKEVPSISLGVRGPKSLAISGRVADGTILAELAAPSYVSWALDQIRSAQQPESIPDHRLTVFVFAIADSSIEAAVHKARPIIGPTIASGKINSHLAPMGILTEVISMRDRLPPDQITDAIPQAWIEELALLGTREDWQTGLEPFIDAGADCCVLVPLPGEELSQIQNFANHLMA